MRNKQSGISLLELMLSLAIIAILLVMATRYYQSTRNLQQVDEAYEIIISMYNAGSAYVDSGLSLDDNALANFVANGSVPTKFQESDVTPWAGAITTKGSSGTQLMVNMLGVPETVCRNLYQKVLQKMPNIVDPNVNWPACLPANVPVQTFSVKFNLGQ